MDLFDKDSENTHKRIPREKEGRKVGYFSSILETPQSLMWNNTLHRKIILFCFTKVTGLVIAVTEFKYFITNKMFDVTFFSF